MSLQQTDTTDAASMHLNSPEEVSAFKELYLELFDDILVAWGKTMS